MNDTKDLPIAIQNTLKALNDAGRDYSNLNLIPLSMDALVETPFGREHVYIQDFAQVLFKGMKWVTDINRHFYHDGTMICHGRIMKKTKMGHKWTFAFWKFNVCDHIEMEQNNLGNCLNQYVCKKCGYTTVVDSSD